MFHVVEHLPPEHLLALLPLIARKLRAGGLLAIETPNPGNLLMGSHYFWNDPTHRRPLPEALLRFMLEYTGFAVIEASGLNPFPAENHLPWTELDVVRQVEASQSERQRPPSSCVRALGEIGDTRPEVIKALVIALAHPDVNMRDQAATALDKLSVSSIEVLDALIAAAQKDPDSVEIAVALENVRARERH